MKFTWNEDKAAEVKKEHYLDFAQLPIIFNDPFPVEFVDESHSTEDETRYAIIGLTGYGLVYWVYTEPAIEEIHLITARLAEPWMVDEYEENKRRH